MDIIAIMTLVEKIIEMIMASRENVSRWRVKRILKRGGVRVANAAWCCARAAGLPQGDQAAAVDAMLTDLRDASDQEIDALLDTVEARMALAGLAMAADEPGDGDGDNNS